MIIDIAQLANGIEVSWVNEAGGVEISNYHVCDIPYQYPIWKVAESQRPEYAGIKDYRNLPVERAYAKRFNQFDLLQFLQSLPIIIATKLDKLKRSQVQKNLKAIREGLQLKKGTTVIPYSAETKQGRDEIWELIESLTGGEPSEEA